jgi:hypothetical protein
MTKKSNNNDHEKLENMKKIILEWKIKEKLKIDQETDDFIKSIILIRDRLINNLKSKK